MFSILLSAIKWVPSFPVFHACVWYAAKVQVHLLTTTCNGFVSFNRLFTSWEPELTLSCSNRYSQRETSKTLNHSHSARLLILIKSSNLIWSSLLCLSPKPCVRPRSFHQPSQIRSDCGSWRETGFCIKRVRTVYTCVYPKAICLDLQLQGYYTGSLVDLSLVVCKLEVRVNCDSRVSGQKGEGQLTSCFYSTQNVVAEWVHVPSQTLIHTQK